MPVTRVESRLFDAERALRALLEQLGTTSLDGFGLDADRHPAAIQAAGGLVQHLRDTQRADLEHLRTLAFRTRADHLVIDAATFDHLEVLEGAEGVRSGSLLAEIDITGTPMGGRLLRAWLLRPLAARDAIVDRLDAVEDLLLQVAVRGRLRADLARVQDLERLIARVALGTAGPRDLVALGRSVGVVPAVRGHAAELRAPLIGALLGGFDELRDVHDRIAATLVEDPPALARDGGAIRDGVDDTLDELRTVSRGARHAIAAMETAERERTGIGSLKIRFNRVFGYYIEVSAANLHAVPNDYRRKQTIANGERYITPALKDYEEQALGADERLLDREQELFDELRGRVLAEANRIQRCARALATLDVLAALAETAARRNYVKPRVRDDGELAIADARHPVVESRAESFVPNDVRLNETDHQVVVLTGPNMGGKSTYLRQTALIVLLAQAGSFVPAREATLPIIDRIFARIGAADNLARGQSTFMVEMQETARIMHQATSRSLVLLDEIGRGTATFDGLSIAWAVAEHLTTQSEGPPEDALRHPLPRAHGPGRSPPGGRQLPRGGARMAGRHRLPPQGRTRTLGSQLWNPGRETGRFAAPRPSSEPASSWSDSSVTSFPAAGAPRSAATRANRRASSDSSSRRPPRRIATSSSASRPSIRIASPRSKRSCSSAS